MSEFYVMRGAQGRLRAVGVKGRELIEAADRERARRVPRRATRRAPVWRESAAH